MRLKFLVAAAVLLAPMTALAADPAVTFQTQPAGKILNDVRSIAKLIGGEKAAAEFNNSLKEKLGDKGLDGLDLDRPVLGYVVLAEKIDDSVAVVAVPVTGEKEFLALLERLEAPKPKAGDKGLYEFPTENEKAKVLMRFEARHAYFAIGKDPTAALDPKALVPAAKLHDPAEKGFASFKVHFDRFPKALRDELGNGLKELKTKLDELRLPMDAGESARKAVDELVKLGNRYADLLQDAETAGGRLILDAASGEAAVEIGLTGKPGSALAKVIGERKPSTNKFAGLITPDTVAGFKLQLPLFAKEVQSAAVIGLEAGQKKLAEQVPAEFKPVIEEAFKGLIRTVNDGEFDVALSLRGPNKDGLYTVVGAVAFEDTAALEKELLALYKKELPPMYKGWFNLDVAKVENTSIHQIKVGGLLPPEVQKVFGEESSVALAFAPKGIYVVFGPDAVNVMKEALAVKKGPSPAFEVVVNPGRIGKLVAAAGVELPPGFNGQDKVIQALAVSIEGGKELRIKIGTNLKAFEGIGTWLPGAGAAPATKFKD
ncbi:hypothetical protein [Gemmata sp.]|uniref:hypothetical protein n=1 Tax=Gemmata sp. TaxID=1914242 RepID=UPI003F6F0318